MSNRLRFYLSRKYARALLSLILILLISLVSWSTAASAATDFGPVVISPDGRYKKNNDGIVFDTKTRLEWYAGPNMNVGCEWAQNWIDGLSVDGGEWRIPSLPELRSLYSKETKSGFATNQLDPKGWYVWSVCRDPANGVISAFDFKRGRIISEIYAIDSARSRALAVRKPKKEAWNRWDSNKTRLRLSPMTAVQNKEDSSKNSAPEVIAIDGRFKKTSLGVVRDTQTKLEWYPGPNMNVGCEWAQNWIDGLAVDGGEWRIPSLPELRSLYNKRTKSGFATNLLDPKGWYVWSVCQDPANGVLSAFDFKRGRIISEIYAIDSARSRALAVRKPLKEVWKKWDSDKTRLRLSAITAGQTETDSSESAAAEIVAIDGRFKKTSLGVVRDTQTKLEWYLGPNMNVGCEWAKNWIDGLDVDGGEWRTPSLAELRALYSNETESGFATSLLDPKGWYVWSVCNDPANGVISAYDFKRGRIISEIYAIDSARSRAIAVRKPPEVSAVQPPPKTASNIGRSSQTPIRLSTLANLPKKTTSSKKIPSEYVGEEGRFSKADTGIVQDTKTGLEWYSGPNSNIGCIQARSWIRSLDVDGGGWRLPSLRELRSLFTKKSESGFATNLLNPNGWYVWSACDDSFYSSSKVFDFRRGRQITNRHAIDSSRSRALAVRDPKKRKKE